MRNGDPKASAASVAAKGSADHQTAHSKDGKNGEPQGDELREIRVCEG